MAERVTLAVTGASGVQYAMRLLGCLVEAGVEVSFLISQAAQLVVATETEWQLPPKPQALEQYLTEQFKAAQGQIKVYGKQDWMAPVASGSGAPAAMVVCPCSTGTLSAIATGASNNLIERAADVALKEDMMDWCCLLAQNAPLQAVLLLNATPSASSPTSSSTGSTSLGSIIHPEQTRCCSLEALMDTD